jgi:hypothetical protein
MFTLWNEKTKNLFEINVDFIYRETEYEQKLHQLEAFEYNIKKNSVLIDQFQINNSKIKLLLDYIQSFFSIYGNFDIFTIDMWNVYNSAKATLEEIMELKSTLDSSTVEYNKSINEIKSIIKTREENKKIFDFYSMRIFEVMKRRRENYINSINVNEVEESIFFSVYNIYKIIF